MTAGRPDRALPLFRSQPVSRPKIERDEHAGLAPKRSRLPRAVKIVRQYLLINDPVHIADRHVRYESGFSGCQSFQQGIHHEDLCIEYKSSDVSEAILASAWGFYWGIQGRMAYGLKPQTCSPGCSCNVRNSHVTWLLFFR